MCPIPDKAFEDEMCENEYPSYGIVKWPWKYASLTWRNNKTSG